MYTDFEISGPRAIGPGIPRHPIVAQTPAGPVSLPWRERSYSSIKPQLAGMGLTWDPDWFAYAPDSPTFGVTSYAPYCQNLIPWVLGTALVVMLLTGKK